MKTLNTSTLACVLLSIGTSLALANTDYRPAWQAEPDVSTDFSEAEPDDLLFDVTPDENGEFVEPTPEEIAQIEAENTGEICGGVTNFDCRDKNYMRGAFRIAAVSGFSRGEHVETLVRCHKPPLLDWKFGVPISTCYKSASVEESQEKINNSLEAGYQSVGVQPTAEDFYTGGSIGWSTDTAPSIGEYGWRDIPEELKRRYNLCGPGRVYNCNSTPPGPGPIDEIQNHCGRPGSIESMNCQIQ